MKALVFDLDDTLLNKAKKIGPRTRRALDAWLASGRKIMIATSRPIRKVRAFLPEDYFLRCEIISMNGVVRHSAGVEIYKAPGLGERARAIVDQFPTGHEIRVIVELNGEAFAANYNYTDDELMHWNAAKRDMLLPLDSVDYDHVGKVVLSRWGPQVNDLLPWLHSHDYDILITDGGSFITILSRGMDKAATLARWLTEQNIDRGEFAVFGDDTPDIEMMKLSNHAVAMTNAIPDVKAVAHHVIGHCDEDAIGPYIEQWL